MLGKVKRNHLDELYEKDAPFRIFRDNPTEENKQALIKYIESLPQGFGILRCSSYGYDNNKVICFRDYDTGEWHVFTSHADFKAYWNAYIRNCHEGFMHGNQKTQEE